MSPGRGRKAAVEPTLTMTPPPCFAHVRDEGLRSQEDRLDVDRHDAVELRLLDLHQGLVAVGGAGVVDENVDPPEGLDCGLRRALHVLAARYVGHEGDRAPADPPGGGLGHVRLHVEAGDARSLPGESLGNAVTEPLPGACDQGRLAFQAHRRILLKCNA